MRFALVGDSHAQALWPRLSSALMAAGDQVVLSVASPGWSESRYLSDGRIADMLRDARPDRVLYELGGNNRLKDPAAYATVLERLVELARAAGADVRWVGPGAAVTEPWAGAHETTAELQARLLEHLGVPWFDSRPVTQRDHRDDGVHFTGAGYDRWAAALLPYARDEALARADLAGTPVPARGGLDVRLRPGTEPWLPQASVLEVLAKHLAQDVEVRLWPRAELARAWARSHGGATLPDLPAYSFRAWANPSTNEINLLVDETETPASTTWLLLHELAHLELRASPFVTTALAMARARRPRAYWTSDAAHQAEAEERIADWIATAWFRRLGFGRPHRRDRLWWRRRVQNASELRSPSR